MRNPAFWRCLLIGAFLVGGTSCSGNAARAIRGTDQVSVDEFSISLSPDEQWLAFTEWVEPKAQPLKAPPRLGYDFRIATLNLKTGQVTHHGVESLPPADLGFNLDERLWQAEAGLEIIQQRFRPPGWNGGLFYFQPYFGGIQVALDPRSPGMQIVSKPLTPGTCSDCPPVTSVYFMGRSWDLLSSDVTAVLREGEVQAVYYVTSPFRSEEEHQTVYRATGAAEQVVLQVPNRPLAIVAITSIRVSPDGRYLAYVVYTLTEGFLVSPRRALFIRDLRSGRVKKIATYNAVSNTAWSGDGRRLYFAGGDNAGDAAVWVVDVAAAFSW